MDDLNLNPIDSFIIYAHDQNKNTIINPVDIRDSAFKRDQIVFKPQLPFQQQQPQILRSNTLQEVEPIVRSKIKILSTMVIDNQFNLEQERMNKTWNQSHKPIFVAVDNIEKAINKYNKEIPEFLKDDFMKSITINNFYQDLENVNAELNKSKRYMEKKSELDNLFFQIICYLEKKEPKINSQYQYQEFLRATFQLMEKEFLFEKLKTY